MKIKIQFLLALAVIILVLLGSAVFTLFSYRLLVKQLELQIAKDNQVLGEQLLNFIAAGNFFDEDSDKKRAYLQEICDKVELPNGGFVCAVSPDGMLIAKPGLKPGETMSFDGTTLTDFVKNDTINYVSLPVDQSYSGVFKMGGESDIVSIVPIGMSGIRLAVHQNQDKVKENARQIINPLILIGLIVSLSLGGITYLFTDRVVMRYEIKLERINRDLQITNRDLNDEKQKTDKLLLNILPVRVARELKDTGKTTPEVFENATVMFTDIVEFTNTVSDIEPHTIIEELNDIFTNFDRIIKHNGCERIKTIGDGYMAVSGMQRETDHAYKMLKSAMEILDYIQVRATNSKYRWRLRVGIHSGKIVGGVVGTEKYIYDVFGDTINTASRMEVNSLPMKINISDTTFNLIKNRYKCTGREPLDVKGKGMMKMFFVEEYKV